MPGRLAPTQAVYSFGMDELVAHDVVKHQSEGDGSLSGVIATNKPTPSAVNGELQAPHTSNDHPHQKPLDNAGISQNEASYGVNKLVNGDFSSSTDAVKPVDRGNLGASLSEDDGADQTQPDGSAGSDSDNTKQTSSDQKLEDKGHARTNSLKKPSAFRPVSVTKSFLAKSMMGTSTNSKSGGEKNTLNSTNPQGPAVQAPSRPRLVMKSTSGLRDSIPLSANGGKPVDRDGIPDGSKVWNKNKPVQPAAPKHLTDEELKQQYDIHLAPRLQADEGKEAKWADIDDEDASWLPETIEWTDGTKNSLPNPEEQRPSRETYQQRERQLNTQKVVEGIPATRTAEKPIVKANLTQFKITGGANATKGPGLVLKGQAEKPTLIAKATPSSTPTKSPWATLPPVDKAAPITINPQTQPFPQMQQPNPRFSQRNPHGFEDMPPQPAKEIAADDFNRTWRDSQPSSNRELFNSQSGRYEPVADGRRHSIRQDQQFRQPSVLQRPSPTDSTGVAEPSAAFQTQRSGAGPETGWGRRRGSSNLSSGGPVPATRRLSTSRPSDNVQSGLEQKYQRSGAYSSMEAPSPVGSKFSHQQQPQSATYRSDVEGGPTMTHPQNGQSAPNAADSGQPSGVSGEDSHSRQKAVDPLAMQAEVMKNAKERARQRRAEEEKEEAERKERLRIKLEALGGPRKETKTESKETVSAMPNSTEGPGVSTSAISPPKPPVPEVSGEVRQYGLMKVHHPETIRSSHRSTGAQSARDMSNEPARRVQPQLSNNPAGLEKLTTSQDQPGLPASNSAQGSPLAEIIQPATLTSQHKQSWKPAAGGRESYDGWAGSAMTNHTGSGGNLWGPPSSDKALGNGTFDSTLGRMPPPARGHPSQLSPAPVPGPIGPPSSSPRLGGPLSAPQVIVSFPHSTAQLDARQEQGPFHSLSAPHHNLIRSSAGPQFGGQQSHLPIGAANPSMPPMAQMSHSRAQQAKSSWASFPQELERREREEAIQNQKELAARRELEERTGLKQDAPQASFVTTWKEVRSDGQIGSRQLVNVSKKEEDLPQHQPQQQPNVAASSLVRDTNAPRPSRFFPQNVDLQRTQQVNLHFAGMQQRSSSPPPPDSEDHPVCDGDQHRPHVQLPVPKPVVRLPPSSDQGPAQTVQAVTSQPSPEVVLATTTSTHAWQDKFNDLFGRKAPSPPRTYALAVNASAAPAVRPPTNSNLATVLLPKAGPTRFYGGIFVIDGKKDVTSKVSSDALLGEPDVGSKPAVRIPSRAPPNLYDPARSSTLFRNKSRLPKFGALEILSVGIFDPHHLESRIRIRLPMLAEKFVLRARSNNAFAGRQHKFPNNANRRKSGKARDPSGKAGAPHSSAMKHHSGGPSGQWHSKAASAVASK